MEDVFEVQDEIARKIAEALRITLSPQEQAALAAKPTENLQAYDLYLRGKSYARRLTRQDLEFALQMFENAVALDPEFALAYAAIANVCALYHYNYERDTAWMDRARDGRRASASALQPRAARGRRSPRPGCSTPAAKYDEAVRIVRQAIERKRDCEGAYYLLRPRAVPAGQVPGDGRHRGGGDRGARQDYNVYVPDHERARRARQEGGAARTCASAGSRSSRRTCAGAGGRARAHPARRRLRRRGPGRRRDARSEPGDGAAAERGDGALQRRLRVLPADRKTEALDALRKAWEAGFRDADWARRDPDLAILHGDPEFERLYPERRAVRDARDERRELDEAD